MNIFVGCSSRDTSDENYNRIATEIGNFIVAHKHNLVFGGCKYGLMGKVYEPVSTSTTSKVFVTIASAYISDLEDLSYHTACSYDTVNERKNGFLSASDVLVFLPGGLGTLDELFSAIESKRADEHYIPILIVNANGFFDHFFGMLNRTLVDGFADDYNNILYHVVETAEDAIAYLSEVTKR